MALIFAGTMMSLAPAPADAGPNCRCRLFGEYFEIGTIMCIRGNLRRCEMNLNNTSWKQIADICPQANYTPRTDEQPYKVLLPKLAGLTGSTVK